MSTHQALGFERRAIVAPRGRAFWHPTAKPSRLRWWLAVVLTLGSAVVLGEGLCWLLDRAAGIEPFSYASLQSAKLPPGSEFHGASINQLGYRGNDFRTETPDGVLRVAVLGHSAPLTGSSETNSLALIERRMPGVELYNFALPQLTPAEYAAQFKTEVARYRPDVVVVFIQVGDDLRSSSNPAPSYDWRSLRLVQWTAQALELSLPRVHTAADAELQSPEQQLRGAAQQLAICRTPIDAAQRQQWSSVSGHLRALAARCQARQMPLALVLVPCDFQVSLPLRDVLVRRAGIESSRLDFDLPQRQFERLAQEQHVAAIDLLPHFRSAKVSCFERDRNELNAAGNAIVAQVLGGWLESRYGKQIAGRHSSPAADRIRR